MNSALERSKLIPRTLKTKYEGGMSYEQSPINDCTGDGEDFRRLKIAFTNWPRTA